MRRLLSAQGLTTTSFYQRSHSGLGWPRPSPLALHRIQRLVRLHGGGHRLPHRPPPAVGRFMPLLPPQCVLLLTLPHALNEYHLILG